MILDAFLDLTMTVGGPGAGSDQLRDPSGLAFLPDGSFVVSDRANRRLAVYGRLGFFERTVGGEFVVDNPFVAPQGLACDRAGNLFVADMGSGEIHVLDRRQRLLFSAGPDFALRALPKVPVDVAVGPGDLLAVTDRARAAVLRLSHHLRIMRARSGRGAWLRLASVLRLATTLLLATVLLPSPRLRRRRARARRRPAHRARIPPPDRRQRAAGAGPRFRGRRLGAGDRRRPSLAARTSTSRCAPAPAAWCRCAPGGKAQRSPTPRR